MMDFSHVEFAPIIFDSDPGLDVHENLIAVVKNQQEDEARAARRQDVHQCVLRGLPLDHDHLGRLSNKDSVMHRLPNELLSSIMIQIVQDLDMPAWLLTTICLASVCFRWHQIVHGCPQMWSFLKDSMGMEKVSLCLAKSGGAPLHICCEGWNRAVIDLVIPHIHRWKSFTFTELTPRLRHLITNLLCTEQAPLIETLKLPKWRPSTTDLTVLLFGGHVPRLRHLDAASYCFDWSSLPLSNLTYINIAAPHLTTGYTEQYYNLLESCTNLEHLGLQGDYRPGEVVEPPFSAQTQWRCFHLPRLQYLNLRWLPSEIVGLLLSSIQASEAPRISVTESHHNSANSTDMMLPSPLFPKTIVPSAISTALSIFFDVSDGLLYFGGISVSFDAAKSRAVKEEEIVVVLGLAGTADSTIALFRTILSHPTCFSRVTDLEFSGGLFFPDISSIALLAHLNELSSLTLVNCAENIDAFFNFISTGSVSGQLGFTLPCRKLRQLSLSKVINYDNEQLAEAMEARYSTTGRAGNQIPLPLTKLLVIKDLTFNISLEVMNRLHAILGDGVCSWKAKGDWRAEEGSA